MNLQRIFHNKKHVAVGYKLLLVAIVSISHTIRMYDMSAVRIRWSWPGESRLGRLAMDFASSVSIPLSPLPRQISGLVLEGMNARGTNPFGFLRFFRLLLT